MLCFYLKLIHSFFLRMRDKHHHLMGKTDTDFTFWQQRDQFSQTLSSKLTSNQRSLFINIQRFWQVTSVSYAPTHYLSRSCKYKSIGVFYQSIFVVWSEKFPCQDSLDYKYISLNKGVIFVAQCHTSCSCKNKKQWLFGI